MHQKDKLLDSQFLLTNDVLYALTYSQTQPEVSRSFFLFWSKKLGLEDDDRLLLSRDSQITGMLSSCTGETEDSS